MPDETDAFGRPLRPEETDPFGAPIETQRDEEGSAVAGGWAPPQAPPDTEWSTRWEPPGSRSAPPGEPAGWWRRVGATILDGLLIGTVGAVIGTIVAEATNASEDGATAIGLALALAIGAVYYGVLMSRPGERNGQTWGKQATEIRVVRVDGKPLTFGFALIREVLVKTLLFGYLAFITFYVATVVNYLWPLWDDQHRALHDRIVKTLVRQG